MIYNIYFKADEFKNVIHLFIFKWMYEVLRIL